MKHIQGRIIVRLNKQQKYQHTFQSGVTIQLERDANNLDRKETEQTLGEVVSADNIPQGALILFSHNAVQKRNEIVDYAPLSGDAIAEGTQYYSFPETDVYLWRTTEEDKWQPLPGFIIVLKVFRPYEGILQGIAPKEVKEMVYVLTGHLKGKVCKTVKASAYPIVFRNERGVEQRILRSRHYEDEYSDREEILAIDNGLTDAVQQGSLLVGLSPQQCSTLTEPLYT